MHAEVRFDSSAAAIFSTLDLDNDTYDLRAPNAYEFSATSRQLPAPTLAIIYPRRATCEPTDDEWPALERKGWTREKLGRLHRLEFSSNREIVIGPVLEALPGETPSALFAKAMQRLSDLQEYVSFVPADREPSRPIPQPPAHAGAFAGLTLQVVRQQAIARSAFRSQDLAVIEVLYQFYLGRE